MKKILATLVILSVSTTFALTLKEKKQFEDWNKDLKDPEHSYVKSFKDKCGYDISITLDEKFVTPFMTDSRNAASFCDAPRSVMSSMCEDATSKKAISDGVKKIVCKYSSKDGDLQFKLDKKTKTLEMTVHMNASNLDEKAKAFLENNL